jgi:hypothetical protein
MKAVSPPRQLGMCPAGEELGEESGKTRLAAYSPHEFAAVLLSRRVLWQGYKWLGNSTERLPWGDPA